RGDKHYWQVWGNPALPVQAYLRETPRFMSEYGLQAWPAVATVDQIATRAEQRMREFRERGAAVWPGTASHSKPFMAVI
ncbi:hypothetical protein CEJ63_25960, partial [Acinetobacter baumannii]